MRVDWRGVFPAATTQFAEDGSVDLAATGRQLGDMIAAGIDGLIMLGSVGENTVLDPHEKLSVIELAKEVARGRIPVLSGVAGNERVRAPRLPLEGEERARITAPIHRAIETRPAL